MLCFNRYMCTNANEIVDNVEAKVGLEQHAVLLVAHASSQTPTTHNAFLALEEVRVPLQSPPPPMRQARQPGPARRLLRQSLLRAHHPQLDQEPPLTRAIHFLESTSGLTTTIRAKLAALQFPACLEPRPPLRRPLLMYLRFCGCKCFRDVDYPTNTKQRCRDTLSKTTVLSSTLADIRAANQAGGNYAGQFVVYDLPDRDCAAAASNGEYSIADNGVADYKNYIDTIVGILKTYSDIRTILIIGKTLLP